MAVDYFLLIKGIPGESKDATHKNEIELENWSFGEVQSGKAAYGSGMGVGRVSPQDFHFIKRIDKSSPKLMQACASGEAFAQAVLVARKAGKVPQEYLRFTFEDLIISSYQTAGSAASDILPRDEIAFNFAKLKCEYRRQLPDGNLGGAVRTGWDMKSNKEI